MSEVRAIMGDCLDVMPTLDAASVSLIVSDPPYHRIKDLEWDRQWATDADYLDWIGRLCGEWRRLMRPNGSLYVFASPRMAARVECKVAETFEVLASITWTKPNLPGFDGWKQKCSKESLQTWYPHSERIIFAGATHVGMTIRSARDRISLSTKEVAELAGAFGEVNHGGAVSNWEAGLSLPTRLHYDRMANFLGLPPYDEAIRPFFVDDLCQYTDVWDFPTVPAAPGKHPCSKPLAMYEHIVRASSRPGDLVLDPFAGSGVTAEACRRLGRPCILIERDPHWFARLDRPHMTGPAPTRKVRKVEEMPLFAETRP